MIVSKYYFFYSNLNIYKFYINRYRNLNNISYNADEEDSLENYWEHFMATDFEDYNKEIVDYIVCIIIFRHN